MVEYDAVYVALPERIEAIAPRPFMRNLRQQHTPLVARASRSQDPRRIAGRPLSLPLASASLTKEGKNYIEIIIKCDIRVNFGVT